jgi:hypothetical protein
MSKFRLPPFLEEMPDGPHKRDEIRHFVKQMIKKRKEDE